MKTINLKDTIKDKNGEVFKQKYVDQIEGQDPIITEVDATIGVAIRDCVVLEDAASKELTETNVLTRLDISERIKDAETVDLTEDEINFIKVLILQRYNAITAAQYIRILNK